MRRKAYRAALARGDRRVNLDGSDAGPAFGDTGPVGAEGILPWQRIAIKLARLGAEGAVPVSGARRAGEVSSTETVDNVLPGDERQQRQVSDWVRRGFWLRDGVGGRHRIGPIVRLPPGLIAWCHAARLAAAA